MNTKRGVSPRSGQEAYLGEREEELMKKRGRQTGKERFTIHASLCGRGDLLKAPGSVTSYLADRLFNLSNDNKSSCNWNNRLMQSKKPCNRMHRAVSHLPCMSELLI